MDFGTLLHTAQKNGKTPGREPVRYYSTKFEPPKKEQRNKDQLSVNVKKFLAKKAAEEKEKRLDALKKKEELLALRAKDKKATRCMNVMLKRTKSANQSVIQDAVDSNNTSVTLAGPIQPDEDDYGYVSQEAAAFYNQMMEKYSKMPDEPKFNLTKKKVSMDLASTKERVRAAIEREKAESLLPHKRKRKSKSGDETETYKREEEMAPPRAKTKPRPMAPALNFNDLLKLAEKKQFEPIVIEQKPKEVERPLTKKQKKELEREKEWKDRKEGRLPPLETKANEKIETNKKNNLGNPINKSSDLKKVVNNNEKTINVPSQSLKPGPSKTIHSNSLNKNPIKRKEDLKATNDTKYLMQKKPDLAKKQPIDSNKPKQVLQPKQFPPADVRRKEFPPADVRRKEFPPKDVRRKPFPPADVRRKEFPPKPMKNKPQLNKRRILDDDEDYDSEMDDFIDDGPEEENDYSKYISEIFGYDKSKYRHADDDIDNMESTFAQQMREEVISTKIGIMEDLEDMKMEEEEKRRKALSRKRK